MKLRSNERGDEAVVDTSRANLFPVGFPLGFAYRSEVDPSDVEAPIMGIRIGDGQMAIDILSYSVWEGAFKQHTRQNLLRWADEKVAGADRMDERLDDLIEEGLVSAVPAEVNAIADFFARHRMVPTAIGGGNSENDITSFDVLYPDGAPRYDVNAVGYSIWAWSGRAMSILEVIRHLNQDWRKDERELIELMYMMLADMLEHRVCVLDVP